MNLVRRVVRSLAFGQSRNHDAVKRRRATTKPRTVALEPLEERTLLFGNAASVFFLGLGEHGVLSREALSFLKFGTRWNIAIENEQEDLHLWQDQHHFSNSFFNESKNKINGKYLDIRSEANPQSFDSSDVEELFGELLHTVQDFYAHSNWVCYTGLRPTLAEAGLSYWDLGGAYNTGDPSAAMFLQGSLPSSLSIPNPVSKNATASDYLQVDVVNSASGLNFTGIVSCGAGDDNQAPEPARIDHKYFFDESNEDDHPSDEAAWKAYHSEAYSMAVQQTEHEFGRLCYLVDQWWGESGLTTLLNQWVKGDDASRQLAREVRVETAIRAGIQWLREQQFGNGSWRNDAANTSMAVLTMLNWGYTASDPVVAKGIEYILSQIHPADGSVGPEVHRYTYRTSMAILPLAALVASGHSEYVDEVAKMRTWLVNSQWDESSYYGSVSPGHWYYGGFGYGNSSRPDLSNTQWALMGLKAADRVLGPHGANTYSKALIFLDRCRRGDGGSGYVPWYPSIHTMTAASVWSYNLCGVGANDWRVQAGLNWLDGHYSVTNNDGWGYWSEYYYKVTFAKALVMSHKTMLGNHDWFADLSLKLIDEQRPAGNWPDTGMAGAEMSTAWAILALQTRTLPPSGEATMWMTLESHADLHVYDPLGRHLGVDYDTASLEQEIPGATLKYYEDVNGDGVYQPEEERIPLDLLDIPTNWDQVAMLPTLVAGSYRTELVGTSHGPYELTVWGEQDGTVVTSHTSTGNIATGQRLATSTTVTAMEGALTLLYEELSSLPTVGVSPDESDVVVQPGTVQGLPFEVSEIGGESVLHSVSMYSTDLVGPWGTIPGSSVTFDVNHFDVPAGGTQLVNASIPIPADFDGEVSGAIVVESSDGGTKSIEVTLSTDVPPQLAAVGVTPSIIDENQWITLTGSFTDPNPLDSHTLVIDWDDGNVQEIPLAVGVRDFSYDHQYLDDGPSGTATHDYTIEVTVADDVGSDTASTTVTVNNAAPMVMQSPSSLGVQYSDYLADDDQITILATDVPGDPLSAVAEYSNDGGASFWPLPAWLSFSGTGGGGGGIWTIAKGTSPVDVAPGDYLVRVTVSDDDLGSTSVDATIVVEPEDALATYTGALVASTASIDSGLAAIALSATIQDVDDGSRGDVTNATVTFYADGTPVAGPLAVQLVDPDDPTTGTAAYLWTTDIKNALYADITVIVDVGGYYTGTDMAVVNVYKPAPDFITGGGYLINEASAGAYAGDPGLRTNFGLNVKFNRRLTNVQGHVNVIVRQDEHAYQIKTNATDSLVVDPINSTATFTSKANLTDVTDPFNPQPVAGNLMLVVDLSDGGEPGSSDSIGMTLWGTTGGLAGRLLFSSRWDGVQTIGQYLDGGNLAVHAAADALHAPGCLAAIPTDLQLPTPERLQPVAEQAIAAWSGLGLDQELVSSLAQVEVRIADLPGSTLGLSFASTVWIDRDAAGYGWRVDPSTTAVREMDLLSAVTHEFGHFLGLDHDAPYGAMAATLDPGARTVATPLAFKSQMGYPHALHLDLNSSTPGESPFSVGNTPPDNQSDTLKTLTDDRRAVRVWDQFFEWLAVRPRRAVLINGRTKGIGDHEGKMEAIGDLADLLAEAIDHEDCADEVPETPLDEDPPDTLPPTR